MSTTTPTTRVTSPSSQDQPDRESMHSVLNFRIRKPNYGPRHLAVKNHAVAAIGEFVGTCLFLIFAFGGTNVANMAVSDVNSSAQPDQTGATAALPNTSNLLYIAFSFGISLTVVAWCLFNPAITLGMFLVGAMSPVRAVILAFAQILGGITGAAITEALLPGNLMVRTTLKTGISVVRGLFIEMFMTALLMLATHSLLLATEKHRGTFLAPLPIGLALFCSELVSVYYTGGSLNPARTFGPCVVQHKFESYHWLYWVGPALGALVASGFYHLIKYLEYETVLADDDSDDEDEGDEEEQVASPQQTQAPVLQIATDAAGAPVVQAVPPTGATGGKAKGQQRYVVEGTGLAAALLQRMATEQHQQHRTGPHARGRQTPLTNPAYDQRFERLESMMSRILDAVEQGRGSGSDASVATAAAGHSPSAEEKV
uniref:BY PROTMAP: gi/647396238/emb/CDR38262.1/ RHTO0S03e07052g1_1 [Rhodosporidium toruloides] n=1 Tax=Rhodotorula toruloides TaxID=5286 RepID=A0A0K3CC24_RHOTO